MGYFIMQNNFLTRKFTECEYRIKFDIRDCTECDISFECEEFYQNGAFYNQWETPHLRQTALLQINY